MTTEPKPLPCPFCGHTKPAIVPVSRSFGEYCHAVRCESDRCEAFGPVRASERNAIVAWNKHGKVKP